MTELFEIISLNWPAAICLLLGFALVVVELFVSGFGVPGIAGIGLLIAGVVLAADSLAEGLLLTVVIVVLLCLLLSVSLRSASKGRLSKTPLILSNSTAKEDGFTSASDMSYFLGREGVATTNLRPAGSGDFDGVRLDIVTMGEFIDKGERISIAQVEGNRIVVKRV